MGINAMAEEFDPYRKWLGIPPKDQPPNHYRLLGIAHFEDDPDVIENAATRQMVHIRTYQAGKNGPLSQRILNELTAAKLCLLQPTKKSAYDASLREELIASGKLSSSGVLDAVVEEPPEEIEPPPVEDYRSDGRWRVSNDAPFELTSPGPAPVPIPMPVGSPAAPVRRNYAANSKRTRKASGAMPIVLIFGLVLLVGLAIAAAAYVSMEKPKSTKTPSKPASTPEKTIPHKKNQPTNLPVTENKKTPPTQPVANVQPPSGKSGNADPRAELAKARQALEQRDDSNFRTHIAQINFLLGQHKPTDAEAIKADEAHLREVEKELNRFWQAVRDGADKKIPKGEKISFKKHNFEIVSREGEQLKYKFDGVEHTTSIKKLPPRVAMYIALQVFGQDNVEGKIAIVLFQLIDYEAGRDQSSQRLAARLLDELGQNSNPILKRERERAAKPPQSRDEG